ncbi:MAG: palmitoyltransferase akr1 [Chaenotheca gracillima]|nr:MAG: palmitoyltransferase akr1 [Chaenotheca gracillima]
MDVAQDWATWLLGPSLLSIFIGTIVALSLPLLLHLYIYRSRTSTNLPTFLLVGPGGSGKTALATLLEQGKHAPTHTSQSPLTVEVSLPVSTATASSRYRSANDPTSRTHKRLLVVDTPGHGKLRHHALDAITNPAHLKGIIFVVDAANLSSSSSGESGFDGLRETAEYLHDMLLVLQRRSTRARTSKAPPLMPVLIAANKMDLFTALPAGVVQRTLEQEIGKVRDFRSKGLLDSGVSMGGSGFGAGEEDEGQERDWLGGEGADGPFRFKQLEELNVHVDLCGGHVLSEDGGDGRGSDVQEWWSWIGDRM